MGPLSYSDTERHLNRLTDAGILQREEINGEMQYGLALEYLSENQVVGLLVTFSWFLEQLSVRHE